jgi:hypothetical protein
MKKRWILVDKKRGIFLGTYSPEEIGTEWDDLVKVHHNLEQQLSLFALFSKQNPYDFDHAITFPTKIAAQLFAMEMFAATAAQVSITAQAVDGEDKFIHVIDLIKQGYAAHVGTMATHLWDSAEETIH